MATFDYKVVPSTSNGPHIITRISDNCTINVDADDSEFCKFLQDASLSPKSVPDTFRFPEHSQFFCSSTKSSLLDYLKDSNQMLFAKQKQLSASSSFGMADFPFYKHAHELYTQSDNNYGTDTFHRLYGAARIRSHSKDESIDGLRPVMTQLYASSALTSVLHDELKDDRSEIRRASSWPTERTFVYVDVSDFSQYKAGQQALVINALSALSKRRHYWSDSNEETLAQKDIQARLCIGDGYICVFTSPCYGTYFAARLADKIERYNADNMMPVDFHIRIGVHVGPVYHFRDVGRDEWNYVGEGINGGQRVLEAIGKDVDDVVFISGDVRSSLLSKTTPKSPLEQLLSDNMVRALRNRGRQSDKHDNKWRVYELNHTDI